MGGSTRWSLDFCFHWCAFDRLRTLGGSVWMPRGSKFGALGSCSWCYGMLEIDEMRVKVES